MSRQSRKSSDNDNAPRLVYSSETGRVCTGCGKPQTACECGPMRGLARKLGADAITGATNPAPPASGNTKPAPVRVKAERSGRSGKTVTVVRGLIGDLPTMEDTARRLRQAIGTGGTLKDGQIELQGDHVDAVIRWLLAAGHAGARRG